MAKAPKNATPVVKSAYVVVGGNIRHDGDSYGIGDAIDLSDDEFALLPAGLVVAAPKPAPAPDATV